MTTLRRNKRMGALVSAGLLLVGLTASAPGTPAMAAEDVACDALNVSVFHTANPRLNTELLTRWEGEYAGSISKYGFNDDRGVLGMVATSARAGTAPVTRLYNSATADFMFAVGQADIDRAIERGFRVEQVSFHAPTAPSSCSVGVHRLNKGGNFSFTSSPDEVRTLVAEGWTDQGVLFYAKPAEGTPPPPNTPAPPPAPAPEPAPSGDAFSIAVIPDSQIETLRTSDTRFPGRTKWLVDKKSELNLKYVLHTGDVVNWGWLAPSQFDVAKAAAKNLSAAGIPYAWAIGNHDTAVVGHNGVPGSRAYGGAGYVSNPECQERFGNDCKAWLLVRNTEAFNEAFPLSSLKNVGGTFEAGKVDNVWTTFEAGGAKWLVLTLELFPRKEAVAWGAKVVADHPNHNVIVQTHSFATGGGTSGSTDGYGTTSGQYVFDNLVKVYPNVKMVFSGHIGSGARINLTGAQGNQILSFLGTFHSTSTNPVRIVTIDPDTGKVTSRVEAPHTGETWGQFATSDTIKVIR